MGDDERATIGRKSTSHTSVYGHPVLVDPEQTPAPVAPPHLAEAVNGYDSVPPPIAQSLDLLRDGLGEVTSAIGRLWDARNDSSRIDRLEVKIEAYTQTSARSAADLSEFVKPAIHAIHAKLDEFNGFAKRAQVELPSVMQQLERVQQSIEKLDSRIDLLADLVRKVDQSVMAHDGRIADAHKRSNDLEQRVTALEKLNTERALTERGAEMMKTKLFGRAQMLWGVVVAVIAAAVSYGPAVIDWIRK